MRTLMVFSLGMILIGAQAVAAPLDMGEYISIPNADLATMSLVAATNGGTVSNVTNVVGENLVTLDYDLNAYGSSGFQQIQFGWDFGTLPSSYYDLSDFDELRLSFHNDDTERLLVNLYMNTGWTDPSWSHPDVYAQNTWTWLEPGEVTILTLDFGNAQLWGDGHSGDFGAVPRLDYVSALGISFGANDELIDTWGGNETGTLGLDTVPEPATLLLLGGVTAAGAVWRRRRRRACA